MSDQRRAPVATDLPVAALAEHPKNDKQMSPGEKAKLRAHIEANEGQFPRLVVRELDTDSEFWSEDGPKYQIIDGHQRKALLIEMGYEMVPVDIWSGISDERALVLIASMDKLRARSIPMKRAILLNEIEGILDENQMDQYLVEDQEERDRYHSIMEAENRETDEETKAAMEKAAEPEKEDWQRREVILPPAAAKVWDEAVSHIRKQLTGKNRTGQAAEYMAATYLAGTRVVTPEMVEALREDNSTDPTEPTGDGGDASPEESK